MTTPNSGTAEDVPFIPPANKPWRSHGLAFLIIASAIVIVYWPEATFQRAFFYFDVSSFHLPARHWGFSQVRAGYFPQWCRHWRTGFPFVAESQAGICYPPNYLLYPWMPSWQAYTVSFLLHTVMAAWGTYFLLCRWCSWTSGLTAGILFALGGRILVHQIHLNWVEVLAWFPWIIWGLTHFAHTPRRRTLVLTALAAGLQILAGSLPAVICCHVGYGLYTLALGIQTPFFFRAWTRLAMGHVMMVLFAACIGAVLLLPASELLRLSVRGDGLSEARAAWGTMFPTLWTQCFFPYLYGDMGWSTAWLEGPYPWREMGLYHGALILPLAMVGMCNPQRRAVWLMLVLTFGGLVLASGRGHLCHVFVREIPFISSTRIPARFLLLTGCGLCGLAALGLDVLWTRTARPRPFNIGYGWCLGVLFPILGVAVAAWHAYGAMYYPTVANEPTVRVLWRTEFWLRLRQVLSHEMWMTCFFVLIGSFACILSRWQPRLAVMMIVALLVVDVTRYARVMYPTITPHFHDAPPSAAFLQQENPTTRTFIWGGPRTLADSGYNLGLQKFDEIGECLYWQRGLLFDINAFATDDELPLDPARWREFHDVLQSHRHYWRLLGVEWIMTQKGPIPTPGRAHQPAETILRYQGKRCEIHHLSDAAPYAYWCPVAQWVELGAALQELRDHPADPREVVVMEGTAPSLENPASKFPFVTATSKWEGPNRLRVSYNAPAAGYLVINETWYPGWTASRNGQPATIWRANHLFQTVAVPAGTGEVVFHFYSRPLAWGFGISLVAVIIALALVVLPERPSPQDNNPVDLPRYASTGLVVVVVISFSLSAWRYSDAWRKSVPSLVQQGQVLVGNTPTSVARR